MVFKRYEETQTQQAAVAKVRLENMFYMVAQNKLRIIFGLGPVAAGVAFFLIFESKIAIIIGVLLGFILPAIMISQAEKMRRRKFQGQLIDALNSLSQALKAGLSFLQAMELLVEEMPPPISQEFAMLVKQNKMGIPFEKAIEDLNKKMNLEDLNFMTTAILVARETGGNLTELFLHLSDSIRQKNRIFEQVKTLTVQAKLQGIIMSVLPIVFGILVYKMNADFFDIMLQSNIGKILLVYCLVSWIVGTVLLMRLSRVEV